MRALEVLFYSSATLVRGESQRGGCPPCEKQCVPRTAPRTTRPQVHGRAVVCLVVGDVDLVHIDRCVRLLIAGGCRVVGFLDTYIDVLVRVGVRSTCERIT